MRAKIILPTPENLHLTAKAIQRGEVVGMPTETVYGLAGDCFSTHAITQIFAVKERPTFDPLIIHVSEKNHKGIRDLAKSHLINLDRISPDQQEKIDGLIKTFWPGPLTLVLPKHPDVPDLVTSGLSTVAIRMPKHPVAQALIDFSGRPLAAPSANRFGRISPTSAQAVADELGDRIDWILDGRRPDGRDCEIGVESTVIRFEESGQIRILRPGGVPIEKILGPEDLPTSDSLNDPSLSLPSPSFVSPGLLEGHYAPQKPLFILPRPFPRSMTLNLSTPMTPEEREFEKGLRAPIEHLGTLRSTSAKLGILLISGSPETLEAPFFQAPIPFQLFSLSRSGSLAEAAQNLFSTLRELDQLPSIGAILAEPCLAVEGLGYAIQDRLTRASTGSRKHHRVHTRK